MLIGKILEKGAIGLLLSLDSIIYGLVGWAYRVFMAVAGARLLSSEAYTQVANKIYIIVGVLMLFVLSYSILRAIIDPDKNLKEELGGKMIQRVVIAVVGLAMAPMLFNLLYRAQALILDNNIIGNLFFNDEVLSSGEDPDKYVGEIGGYVTATSIWQAFFFPSEESGLTSAEIKTDPSKYLVGAIAGFVGCAAAAAGAFAFPVVGLFLAGAAVISCVNAANSANNYEKYKDGGEITLQDAYSRTSAGDNFNIYMAFIDNYIDEGEITYLWIISTIAGGFALYAFISFSIDMGIRAAKMAYLQIVAPIPLIMQVLPSNKGMFDTYLKSVKNTFLEVFIRVSVVYIVIYIICHLQKLFGSTKSIWGNQDLPTSVKLFALAILILGLIAFCRTAPKIISETLGIKTDGVKLGLMDKLAQGGALGAAGILGAAGTSMVQGFNKEKFQGNNNREKFASAMRKVGHGARGFFGGAARAGWAQYGIGGKEAKTYGDVRGVASKAAQAEGDAIEHAADRAAKRREAEKREREIQEKITEERRKKDAAERRGDTLAASQHDKNIQDLEKEARKARQDIRENTPAGEWLKERGKRIKVWASGTVDLTVEETAIKIGNAQGAIQDKLRAEAAKKDSISKAMEAQEQDYLRQAQNVSEYKEGWNEETYNKTLQDRLNTRTSAKMAELQTKQDALRVALDRKKQLDEAKANGTITEADYNARVGTIDSDIAARRAEVQDVSLEIDNIRKEIVTDLDAVAKRTTEEMTQIRTELQAKADGAKKIKEARQDEWIQEQLAQGNTEVLSIINNELRQYTDFLDQHGNFEIEYEEKQADGTKKAVKKSLNEMLTNAFGAGAVKASVTGSSFTGDKKDNSIVIELDGGASKEFFTFVPAAKKGDASKYVDSSGREYTVGEYEQHLNALVGHITDVSSNTAAANAKDWGKKARINIENDPDFLRKNEMRRQQQEGKK